MISAHHARITVGQDCATIEDLGSTNGTAIERPENRITLSPLVPTDVVFFGSYRVPAAKLLSREVSVGERAHHSIAIQGRTVVLGRNPSCDQVLDYPMVSGRHAKITESVEGIFLEDLGSTNGTFVNGQRITSPTKLKPGDTIGLGSYIFQLGAGGVFQRRDYRGDVTLEARNVGIAVNETQLIEKVSLTVYPSELVGIMGPSGSGKTTLLNALNGYTQPTEGGVLYNGEDLYRHFAQYQLQLGYVPQDDTMHRDLTVGEALYYTARLRLPADFTDEEIHKRIRNVLSELGLEGCEDVLIGSPEKKGISGGQRKRVNIAMELLTDPSVLFLDEPTSGLSSEDALTVMKVLKNLADSGKTILVTIHQPSLEVFRLLDDLVVMAKDPKSKEPGRMAYFGPAYPDAAKFFNPQESAVTGSAEEVLKGLSKKRTVEWVERYSNSTHRELFVLGRSGQRADTTGGFKHKPHRAGGGGQFATLFRRTLSIKAKDSINTVILLAQAPIIALLIVFVFGESGQVSQNTPTIIFLLVVAALWFGCSNSAREIVGEWAVFRRERMVNLRLPAYVGSKFAVLGVFCMIQCILLLGIVYSGAHLTGSWPKLYAVVLLAAWVGVGLGLVVSALAKTSEIAIGLVPLILLPMVILGGMMKPVAEMASPMKALSGLMASRWAFEGALRVENLFLAETYFASAGDRTASAPLAVLVVMLFVLALSVVIILRVRDVRYA
jgi:ABC-type multidrug transport system ATPase subunit/ABC-type multidrug transport system permease subunit